MSVTIIAIYNTIIINKIFTSCIIRRINIYNINLSLMRLLQQFKRMQIISDYTLNAELADIIEHMTDEEHNQLAQIINNLQAQIDLAEHIQIISANRKPTDVALKNIRDTRKLERTRKHIDYTKEVY